MIDKFSGEYDFLSNFYQCRVAYEGLWYKNAEAAFQSAKTRMRELRKEFTDLLPSQAKWLGRRIKLREDWEQVKDEVMYQVVINKFAFNDNLKQKLLATGDAVLVEGNTWNDTYWGVCDGKGLNKLGEILMKVREELRPIV